MEDAAKILSVSNSNFDCGFGGIAADQQRCNAVDK